MITEQHKTGAPGPVAPAGPARRGRRHRGRRRPPGGPRPSQAPKQITDEQAQAAEPLQTSPQTPDVLPPETTGSRKEAPPRELSTLRQAARQVEQILESLQEVLDDMEHVLKVLNEAERQKNVDEEEIESLRQRLNKLQRGRGE